MTQKIKRKAIPGIALLIGLIWGQHTYAQTDSIATDTNGTKPVYFEQQSDGTHFYFDEHYFLVDKSCQYQTIERIGKYNVGLHNFDGDFTDYDREGHPILTGTYVQGKKNGPFTAYFANGQVKWEATFKEDKEEGLSIFNYPDGLPMLEILHEDSTAYIQNFWDNERRQRVTNGEGRFSFSVKAEGYNEYGYNFINYQGSVKGGKPDGYWNITWIYSNNEQDYVGFERFEQGQFLEGYDEINERRYRVSPKVQIGPSLFFIQAEAMVSKGCTIDENQDFTLFLSHKLDEAFEPYDARELVKGPMQIRLKANVNKRGDLSRLEIVDGFEEQDANKIILNALRRINYWIPSYAEKDYIDDVLDIQVDLGLEEKTGQLKFYNLRIQREKGI